MKLEYGADPTPHALIPQLLDDATFAELSFPSLSRRTGGRTGQDLFPGEPGYDDVIATPGWKDLYAKFCSQQTLDEVLGLFADDMRERGCLVDPAKARLTSYVEAAEFVGSSTLNVDADPNELFFRFDIHELHEQKWEFVHTDWRRRVVGGVLFLTTAEEEGMVGGEFALYRDRGFRDDREAHDPVAERLVTFRKNSGALFLNCNTGFHGPKPILAMDGARRWVYFSISSRADVWPCRQPPRRPLRRIGQLLRARLTNA